ncbi:hypothetical protein NE237_020690 [Protea cynaroides]|uniref:Uncharacterized protein n=1 Tax=Protea cynaroides TaxID=273540 RepID=A0A9Q0H7R5_9MAGN|nr:hypothetical protein NE237_020690 [Protea cynaroides]
MAQRTTRNRYSAGKIAESVAEPSVANSTIRNPSSFPSQTPLSSLSRFFSTERRKERKVVTKEGEGINRRHCCLWQHDSSARVIYTLEDIRSLSDSIESEIIDWSMESTQ